MSTIEFSNKDKEDVLHKIKLYFINELDQEIGRFDAEFLLDFFSENIGPYYYNRGLYDARSVLQSRLESIDDDLYEIEKPIDTIK